MAAEGGGGVACAPGFGSEPPFHSTPVRVAPLPPAPSHKGRGRGAGTDAGVIALTTDDAEVIRLTLAVAARAVGFALPLAVCTAALLSRGRFPGRSVLNAVVHLPLVLPPVVTGWLLLVIFGIRGPIGSLLYAWFDVRLAFTTAGAALACGVMVFPVAVRAIRLGFDAADPALDQAARSLGAGRIDRWLTVTLPLVAPAILVGAVIAFATCLGEFGAVITFAANIPGQTQTLPLAIYAALQSPGGEARAAALSLVSLALALAGLLLSELLARRLAAAVGR